MITDLTAREAAAYLRKSVKTIMRMLHAGLFTTRKIGRTWLIDRASLLDYERRHTRQARKR